MALTQGQLNKRYNAFHKKWLGGRVDFDRVYGYQCVDLIKQYAKELYRLRPGSWGNAIEYWYNTHRDLKKNFSRVRTRDVNKGDVVVLETNRTPIVKGAGNGHIVIATGKKRVGEFEALEQNGSTGNGSGRGRDAIRTRYISTKRIAGVLRPKRRVIRTYIIKSGDTLWAIARRFKMSLATLLRRNKQIKNPNKIYPKQKINIK